MQMQLRLASPLRILRHLGHSLRTEYVWCENGLPGWMDIHPPRHDPRWLSIAFCQIAPYGPGTARWILLESVQPGGGRLAAISRIHSQFLPVSPGREDRSLLDVSLSAWLRAVHCGSPIRSHGESRGPCS